jgi:hypothetical protein
VAAVVDGHGGDGQAAEEANAVLDGELGAALAAGSAGGAGGERHARAEVGGWTRAALAP